MLHGTGRDIARLIDAAANRAAEGLRFLEDVARFILDDPGLTERCKSARHTARAFAALALGHAAAGRDTPGDVGATIKAPAEGRRPDLAAAVAAAAKRAQEALRTLEEAAKIAAAAPATGVGWLDLERARYSLYAIESELIARLGPTAPQWRLCVLLTRQACRRPWLEVAEAAIHGGADCLQLREKTLGDRELLRAARALVELAQPHGVDVIINDRADIAALSGARGVHIGQGDLSVAEARAILGRSAGVPGSVGGHGGSRGLVGVSTCCMAEALAAVEEGADVLGLGPMFASATKPKPGLAGPAYLRAVLDHPSTTAVPHLAISGIDAPQAAELAALGCRGVAVSSAVCAADDPQAAARAISDSIRAKAHAGDRTGAPVPGAGPT